MANVDCRRQKPSSNAALVIATGEGTGNWGGTTANPVVVNSGGRTQTVVTTAAMSGTASAAIDLAGNIFGVLYLPSGFLGMSLTFTTSPDNVAAYVPLYDQNGQRVTVPTLGSTAEAVALPPEVMSCQWIKIVSSASETVALTLVLTP